MATPITYTLELFDGVEAIDFRAPPYRILHPDGYALREDDDGAQAVTESVNLVIAEPLAAARHRLERIRRMFQQAAVFQDTRLGSPVWARFKHAPADEQMRSQILAGRIVMADETLDLHVRNDVVVCTLVWERQNWWEGPETVVPLTNANGTDVTAGLPVYNANDGAGTAPNKRTNWVKVLGSNIAGDLPAACRLEITRTYTAAAADGTFFIGQAVLPAVGEDVYVLEAEDATGETTANDAGASGGSYKQIALSGSAEQDTITWTLDGAALLDMLGDNYFLLLGRFFTLPTGVTRTRFEVRYGSSRIGGQVSQTVLLTTELLQNLGLIRLAPVFLGASRQDLALTLLGQKAGGGGFDLDFIQFTPLDGYRELVPVPSGAGLANGDKLVDDMLSDPMLIYSVPASTSKRVPNYTNHARGDRRILLRPGFDQILTFLWSDVDGGADIARRATVQAFYRPRQRLP